MKQALIASVLIVSSAAFGRGSETVRVPVKQPAKNHLSRPLKAGNNSPFRLSSWASVSAPAENARTTGLDLQMSATQDVVEEITVYGRRHTHEDEKHQFQDGPMTIGPATIAGSQSHDGTFSGMTITAAVPIAGVPNLDATFNLSGGHDQLNTSTTAASAAATAGLRLRF